MIRTSFLLPPSTYQQLRLKATAEKKSVSELIRTILDETLALSEESRVKTIYSGLHSIHGKGQAKGKYAASTIDDVLY